MKLIKKLVDWFENLLWTLAIKDVFENPEYYFGGDSKEVKEDDDNKNE